MWERGLELCKELISQYEDETFDYERISTMLVSERKTVRRPGIEPGSIAWKATMLTFTPPTLHASVSVK